MERRKLSDLEENQTFLDRARKLIESLEEVLGNESNKITKLSGQKIRKVVGKLQDIVLEQRLKIGSLYTELNCLKEDFSDEVKTRKLQRSFAEVIKAPERFKKLPEEKNIVLIFPKKEEMSSEAVKSKMYEHLKPAELGIGIDNVRNIKKGGILLECTHRDDIGNIMDNISGNKDLNELVTSREPIRRRPHIIIYDVEPEFEIVEVEKNLLKQNDNLVDSNLEVKFSMKNKNNKRNWVCHLDAKAFEDVIKTGKLNLMWGRYNVKEYVRILKCYKCGRFGHIAKDCKNPASCGTCGSLEHGQWECRATTFSCLNCISSNQKYKKKLNTNHSGKDPKCPTYLTEMNLIKNRTEYLY